MTVGLRPKSMLREQQQWISQEILQNKARLIISKMGSGKTVATLTAIREMLDNFEISKVLIIAPKLVAQETWSDEILTWAHTASLSYSICVGTAEERKAALSKDVELTIVNKDVLPWLAKQLGSVEKWRWDCVIVDESSMFKAGKKRTTRSKVKVKSGSYYGVFFPDHEEPFYVDGPVKGTAAVSKFKREQMEFWGIISDVEVRKVRDIFKTKIRKGGNMTRFGVLSAARRKISRIYLLTGTPRPNGIEDLWGQIYLLDQGNRLGKTQGAFHDRWFDLNRYTHEFKAKPKAEEEILEAAQDLMVSIPTPKLVPDPVYVPIRVKLPPKVLAEYRKFERELYSEPYDVEAITRGVLVNKLLQFANGSMYREDGSLAKIHTEKLDTLDELIERANGDPVLIFYAFKFDLEAIRKRHPDAVMLNESKTAVADWNAGKITKMITHPASCAHGLNLQYGGHIAIWFGPTCSLELYLQANARLPRPGQKDVVAIYQIIAEGTYDEIALADLAAEDASQERMIESLINRRKHVLSKSTS